VKTLGEFQPKNYKVSRSSAKNYKAQQNAANLNISRILVQLDLFFLYSARKSTRQPIAVLECGLVNRRLMLAELVAAGPDSAAGSKLIVLLMIGC